ncbi:MAG: NAD(P)H-dependent oxidoreductase [Eubacteriaceae bacterium]|nr:NAD(P)H-dependent oxidoreductase [Eubacteriaceae bacterium]
MEKILIIKPHCADVSKTERLNDVLRNGTKGLETEMIETEEDFRKQDLKNRKIIFAISLGGSGINLEFYSLLKAIRNDPHMFDGSVGGIIIDGNGELYTKSVSRELVFSANRSGCTFPGRPLVEGTATLFNFNIIAKNLKTDNMGAYRESCRDLIMRVAGFKRPVIEKPKLLVLHAGNATTSNTLALWGMIKDGLKGYEIKEISLRDGEVWDCRGCSYETCLHLGEESRCFYGGVITREVYPAILDCDGLVMVCPNYNDAISANLTAFVNRLTAIFRVHRFYEKRLYAVIVSGYSGSDIIAQQLISGLNMNKTFMLPPDFAMMETANDPRTVGCISGVEEKAAMFSQHIKDEFRGCKSTEK